MITKQQIHHVSRLISQIFSKPQVSIVGGYHGVNLGDIALGESVRAVLKELGYKSGLQTIYNLDRWPWPTTKYSIIGGGAVGYTPSLLKLKVKLNANYSRLAFLGVDFNEPDYSEEIIAMLRESAWISCRNEYQSEKISELTGRTDVGFHPDLVFSYRMAECKQFRSQPKQKVLLVNPVLLYGSLVNGKIVANENYKLERPELYANFDRMTSGYINGIREVVTRHIIEGYSVETVPFTPSDEDVALVILGGLAVKHNRYSDNVDQMLEKISTAKRIFATRYHATILGLKTGAELIPMAYAVKNEKLLNELGVKSSRFISATDLAYGKIEFPEPIVIESDIVEDWERRSHTGIENCINNLVTG